MMQDFRHEYKVENRYKQGSQMMEWVFKLFPEHLLFFGFSEQDGTYIFVHDFSKFEPKKFTRPKMEEDWLTFMYYSHILFFPDFESIRKGIICACECEQMDLRKDVNKLFGRFFSEFLTHYPFDGECRFFNTGAMVNIFASILRKILPQNLRNKFTVGYKMECHLSETFLVPNVEAANARMLGRMKESLGLRYKHEAAFTLC
ncbi:expressed unknown protein [Seminavis robusta]|uniref:Uncharacterized protein n=1 Tax=Seminavis robusta TaxID=568900 RepID=A0A9N8HGA8_9STRA|nr:expressed unknown protein [Seminavis robusta]|eukprot:Sro475_g150310.1 n/a (202) ;mRNA; f:1449-2054